MNKQGRLGTRTPSVVRAMVGKGHILDNLSDLTVVTAGNKCHRWEQNPDFLSFISVTMKDHLELPNNPVITELAGETATKQLSRDILITHLPKENSAQTLNLIVQGLKCL